MENDGFNSKPSLLIGDKDSLKLKVKERENEGTRKESS